MSDGSKVVARRLRKIADSIEAGDFHDVEYGVLVISVLERPSVTFQLGDSRLDSALGLLRLGEIELVKSLK